MLTTRPSSAFPHTRSTAVARIGRLPSRGHRGDTSPVATLLRTSHADRDLDAAALVDRKGDRTVAVCIPARNEARTVGAIVETIRMGLQERAPLVDELVVIDDHSTDRTAAVAAAAGARVIDARSTLPEASGPGKGAALWKSLHETSSDIVVWVDADIDDFGTHFVTGLAGTLLTHPEVSFVKGSYRRPSEDGSGGGRVTELLARPALTNLFPEVSTFSQPLSGEFGGRRGLLERLSFVHGYGVDVALLIDAVHAVGVEGVAEVDLGERRHRNRPLDQLGPQATEVLRAILVRAGLADDGHPLVLRRPGHEPLLLAHHELSPVEDLHSYGVRSA